MPQLNLSKEAKYIFLVAILASITIFSLGIFSDLYLGDETYHFRLSRYIYENGFLPLFDPLTLATAYYIDPPLWHLGLSCLGFFTKGVTQIYAQFYQIGYYLLLVLSTFLFARDLFNKSIAFWSAILVISLPMNIALSIILHTDIPVASFSAFTFWLILRRKLLFAGLSLGIVFLLKRNGYLLIPIILTLIYIINEKKAPFTILKQILIVLTIAFIISVPDVIRRYNNFGLPVIVQLKKPDFNFVKKTFIKQKEWYHDKWGIANFPDDANKNQLYKGEKIKKWYDQSNINYHPEAIIEYLGLLLIFLPLGIIKMDKNYYFMLILVFLYLILYILLCYNGLNIRYISPIICPLVIIGAKGIDYLLNKFIKFRAVIISFILSLFLVQFFVTEAYVFYKRHIPVGLKNAYQWINKQSNPEAVILCSQNAVSLYTKRKAIWAGMICSPQELSYLFWKANKKETLNILNKYKINFILVEKNNIYDDTTIRHLGGYPKSFILKLPTLLNEIILDNSDATIWQVALS